MTTTGHEASAPARPLRIVQWTTGNVARETLPAILERSDLELVGVYAYSADKVGRDACELVGLETATGVVATDDVDALIALAPDCVLHTPLRFDHATVTRLLRAGINVVTSAEFVTGTTLTADQQDSLEAAAIAGGASIFGSGMNPGFASLLAGVSAGISRNVRHVKMSESVDVANFAADANMDHLGWGRPAGDPGHPADVEQAVEVFHDALDVLARILGVDAYERRCTVEFAHATEDLDLPGRPIATGTVAGIDIRFEALVDEAARIELHQRWVMGKHVEPAWKVEHGYVVEVAGDPMVRVKLDIWPDVEDFSNLTLEQMHGIGMRITGLPLVNAIPAVCAAAPGIRTYADLPLISTRL